MVFGAIRSWGRNYGTSAARAAAAAAIAGAGKGGGGGGGRRGGKKSRRRNKKRKGISYIATKRKKSNTGYEGFTDVQGTITCSKHLKYKTTKLDKTASFLGGQFRHETQNFGEIKHLPADEINSQKCVYLTTVYEQADTKGIFEQAIANQPPVGSILNNPVNPIVINQQSSYKFYLNSCTVKVNMTNMSAGSSNIILYAVMAKNTKTSTADAINDWSEGQDDTSGTYGQTAVAPVRIGCIPTQSKLFNMNWWVVDKKKFAVGPGGKINYTFKFSPRNLVDTEYWARNSYVRGMSIQIFAVTYGQMGRVGIQSGGGGNGPYYDLPIPKPVDWIYNINKHYDSKMVQHFPRSLIQLFTYPGIKLSDVNAPVLVREDDGEIEG